MNDSGQQNCQHNTTEERCVICLREKNIQLVAERDGAIALAHVASERLSLEQKEWSDLDNRQRQLERELTLVQQRRAEQAEQERDKLQAFKDWVHAWLTEHDVPLDPNSEKTAATGCRIGGRLEYLFAKHK